VIKTYATQDYIKTITHLSLKNDASVVKFSHVAKKLMVSNAAVTDMVKKLVKDGLIINHAYKGLELTDLGFAMGKRLIRHHRLWEVFLNQVLELPWDEIHDEAEMLEHAASEALMNRIDEFLNFPRVDPHGNPIPDKEGNMVDVVSDISLASCPVDRIVKITRFVSFDSDYLDYISSLGLQVGCEVTLIKRFDFDGSIVVKLNYKEISLTKISAENIFVV
tara:strand:+ start:150 stop:809 length:660 start_codon:yes stop_codon:yes gene_type:complete